MLSIANNYTKLLKFSSLYPAKELTDIDYADDLDSIAETITDATVQIHQIENAAKLVDFKTEFLG